jgi:hypothetical protein
VIPSKIKIPSKNLDKQRCEGFNSGDKGLNLRYSVHSVLFPTPAISQEWRRRTETHDKQLDYFLSLVVLVTNS